MPVNTITYQFDSIASYNLTWFWKKSSRIQFNVSPNHIIIFWAYVILNIVVQSCLPTLACGHIRHYYRHIHMNLSCTVFNHCFKHCLSKIYWKIFHFHYPIELWTFVSPIEKPYYCGVTIITDPAGTMVESVHDKQKVVGSNPCLSKQFFSFFSWTTDRARLQLNVFSFSLLS